MINNTDIFGRKIFFIATDDNLVLPSYMEDFCTLGYEAHIVPCDSRMHGDVAKIVQTFPDSILIFNIDADDKAGGWSAFIKEARQGSGDLLIGVTFEEYGDRAGHVESRYGGEVNPQTGIIPLTAGDKDGNFKRLKDALDRSGAKGRRNNIRAICDRSSHIKFNLNGREIIERIEDINVSHFRCVSDSDGFHNMRIYDKIRDAHVVINGFDFKSDIVLIMKRNRDGSSTAIFMFITTPDDGPGLEAEIESKLNRRIYQIIQQDFINLLRS